MPSLLTVRPDFSYGCEEVLQGALAKDKFDRYNSAMEFAQEVRRLAEGQAARPRRRQTRPLPPLPENGDTAVAPAFNEQTLLQQQPSTGNELIDHVLFYHLSPQEQHEARRELAREARREQEEFVRQRQQAYVAEIAELRAAEEARRQAQAQQAKLIWAAVFGTIAFFLVLALLISVLS